MKKLLFITIFLFSIHFIFAQANFNIYLEPFSINGFTGIQSFAFGQNEGKILLIGGRKDGLHQRQPFASFDAAGNNTDILVIDPETEQIWAATLNNLSIAIKEQLQATNLVFYQDGDYLYVMGGYGYSASNNDHITYDKLTAIHVPDLITAIVNGAIITPYFRQISNNLFAVLKYILGLFFDKDLTNF